MAFPEPLGPVDLDRLIRPAPLGVLEAYRVSTRVNDAREEGPDLDEPIASDETGACRQDGGAQLF